MSAVESGGSWMIVIPMGSGVDGPPTGASAEDSEPAKATIEPLDSLESSLKFSDLGRPASVGSSSLSQRVFLRGLFIISAPGFAKLESSEHFNLLCIHTWPIQVILP